MNKPVNIEKRPVLWYNAYVSNVLYTGCFSRKEITLKQLIHNTALYLRLSRDDELQGESGSISTQRQMLTQYCREQGLRIYDEYVDDGYSGTNFDRPPFSVCWMTLKTEK